MKRLSNSNTTVNTEANATVRTDRSMSGSLDISKTSCKAGCAIEISGLKLHNQRTKEVGGVIIEETAEDVSANKLNIGISADTDFKGSITAVRDLWKAHKRDSSLSVGTELNPLSGILNAGCELMATGIEVQITRTSLDCTTRHSETNPNEEFESLQATNVNGGGASIDSLHLDGSIKEVSDAILHIYHQLVENMEEKDI